MPNLNDGVAETSNVASTGHVNNANMDFYVDMGAGTIVESYMIAPQGTAPSTSYNTPTAFNVYRSGDATNWTLVETFTGIAAGSPGWVPGDYQEFAFTCP